VSALAAWTFDPTAALIVALGVGYLRCHRADRAAVGRGRAISFAAGLVIWLLAVTSPVAVFAQLYFVIKALQVLLLLFVVPLLLASGAPLTVLRAALDERRAGRLDAVLASRPARVVCSPALTSALMLAVPWLLYLTPWYVASLTNGMLGVLTGLALVTIGGTYFYARLQVDPVPHRYTPLLAMGISVVESLADGVLGLVLWLGPLIAQHYYTGLDRPFAIDPRTDQTLGAGVLWILGDRSAEVDAELDAAEVTAADSAPAEPTGLWWADDPQLQERFGRR
jgi:cytochrome c oxidase assembly factor CtaG